jgi:extracellular elastinolytic metalloproteinase
MSTTCSQPHRAALRRGLIAALAAVLTLAVYLPASARAGSPDAADPVVHTLGDPPAALADLDARTGSVAPTAAQVAAVSSLGAHVRWNRFGTPASLIRYGGYLATGLGADPVAAARSFVSANRSLFRLSDAGVAGLQLLADSPIVGTSGHAVMLRQTFGGLPATQDGLITVGVNDRGVFYVSSSAAGDGAAPAAASLSATDAWLRAAANVGRALTASNLSDVRTESGWTTFAAAGFAQRQMARLTAFPTYTQGVRPAYETIVLDARPVAPVAYKAFVDARTGEVLFRQNAVLNLSETSAPLAPSSGQFSGATGGPGHACSVADGATFDAPTGTKSIDVVATADDPSNDIVLNLVYNVTHQVVGSSDTATSPEAIHYTGNAGVVPVGSYSAQVCQFDPQQEGFTYSGFYSVNDTVAANVPYPPRWQYFQANPPLNYSSTDSRVIGCWQAVIQGTPVPGCDLELMNAAARGPWDYDFRANQPTYTTTGNAAKTAQAWTSPLTPGEGYRPPDLNREYTVNGTPTPITWTNQWFTSKCDPTVFASPQRNDIDAAIVNLFAGHNRVHDFAYRLGFTEVNFNMQDDNFGNGPPGPYPAGRENDPELGDVQAGAVDGGAPSYLGRDNANQITLNDGIPGITNQYLFQPIAGALYSPCVDGDYDASVFVHEYTHAISNRMVGGPDANLTGAQAGAMGESWSDLDALELLHEYGLVPTDGENDWAEGPYVTGNKEVGIRDYGLNRNPLNYSDLGFDIPGPEVHADGEIWNGTNYDVRQALVQKYDAQFPSGNATLQRRCADGVLPADQCPGNRRWIQIVYDAWLLQQAATSMLDARDAYLAADVNRFGGADQQELWGAFAHRGMGEDASTQDTNDSNPTPGFQSPLASEGQLTFQGVALDEPGQPAAKVKVYVGNYEARATPVADTDPATTLGSSVRMVAGTYTIRVQGRGYGIDGFTVKVRAGQNRTLILGMHTNWASSANGATATGDGVNQGDLIDDTEATNWASLGSPVAGKQVTVQFAGRRKVQHLHVSAMLRPADANDPNDSGSQNRFSALRSFRILACDATVKNCSLSTNFSTIYTSPANFFPAGIPRPLAPNLIIRSIELPAPVSATHLRLVVVANQCTGTPAYQGEQDNDPANPTDCTTGSAEAQNVRAAELQAMVASSTVTPAS